VEDGVKMTPLDEMYEEGRQCALDLKSSTQKLVRAFSEQENHLKLLSSTHKKDSNEFGFFMDTINNMGNLYETMLSTPKEEVQSIQANLSQLSERISQLKQMRDQKKDQYDKYIEECTKQKEQRQTQINHLKGQVNFERSEKDKAIESSEEQAK